MDAFNLSHFVLVCIPALLLNKVYTKNMLHDESSLKSLGAFFGDLSSIA